MKNIRALAITNSLLLIIVFFNATTWALTGRGVAYLAGVSSTSRYIFYTLLIVSVLYSVFISYLLFTFKKSGIGLAAFWDIFLGLFILVPWLGGYAMLKYTADASIDIGFLTISNLLKGALGVSLVLFGLAFKSLRSARVQQNSADGQRG